MNENATVARRVSNPVLVSVLLLGPVLTVTVLESAIARGSLGVLTPAQYLLSALLFWSPLPLSIPAVLLESARDAALPQLRGLLGWPARAVLLMPYLVVSPRSPVRAEAGASLLGFAAAAVLVALRLA